MQTSKENNYETKTKRYIFSLISDIILKNPVFLYRIKVPYQQCLIFLGFMKLSVKAGMENRGAE